MSTCDPCMSGRHHLCRRPDDHDCVCWYGHQHQDVYNAAPVRFDPMESSWIELDHFRAPGVAFPAVTRFEVIDHTTDARQGPHSKGIVTGWRGIEVALVHLQDDGRTLKVFLRNPSPEFYPGDEFVGDHLERQ